MSSYAVIWRDGSAHSYVGKLELGVSALTLAGRDAGTPVQRTVQYADIELRESDERIDGHRTVSVADSSGLKLLIASLDRPGTAHEFTEQIAVHRARMLGPSG